LSGDSASVWNLQPSVLVGAKRAFEKYPAVKTAPTVTKSADADSIKSRVFPRMRYSAKPGNPSKSSIRQIKLYSVAVKTAVFIEIESSDLSRE